MGDITVYQIVTGALLFGNAALAFAAFVRVGKWRETDDGKKVAERLNKLEGASFALDLRVANSEQLENRMIDLDRRFAAIENEMKHMASRGDMQQLKGEIGTIESIGRSTQAALTRIESFLMERSQG